MNLNQQKPYGYLRETDGNVQLSIGPVRPANRSGGISTPWAAIYAEPQPQRNPLLETRLLEALALLKRSAGYASAYPTIGGHKLNDEICRFREAVQAELETNAQQAEEETHG